LYLSVKLGSEVGGELTGDTDSPDALVLRDYDIIVTTPEKWDAVTRRRKDLAKFMELIQLFLVSTRISDLADSKVDEIHLINDHRGPTLEVIIVRMKIICPQVRIVAVSATIPNINELGQWIGQSWSKGGKDPNFPGGVNYCQFQRRLCPLARNFAPFNWIIIAMVTLKERGRMISSLKPS
jgi:Lhr-like helicase